VELKEMKLVDFVNLDESEPCVFYTWEGEGWLRDTCGQLIRRPNALTFDVFDGDAEGGEPYTMTLEEDGLYHWHGPDGLGHWWGFLSETNTHTFLAGNYINPDGHRGVQFFIWPKQ
jgi:hypothetical protein